MPKVSVVIPVYNVENHICKCLDSILNQTFNDYEIILVDDGSKDKSAELCDEYGKMNAFIHVVHQDNQGVSAARNSGINAAKGEYITFIDSDDYVDNKFFEVVSDSNYDLIVCGYRSVNELGDVISENTYEIIDVDGGDLGEMIYRVASVDLYDCWARFYKRKIINDYSVRFDEAVSYGEDSKFFVDYLIHINSLKCDKYVGYNYVRFNSRSHLSSILRTSMFDELVEIREYALDIISSIDSKYTEKTQELITQSIYRNIYWSVLGVINSDLPDCEKEEILHSISKNKYFIKFINDRCFLGIDKPLDIILASGKTTQLLKRYRKQVERELIKKKAKKKISNIKEILHMN